MMQDDRRARFSRPRRSVPGPGPEMTVGEILDWLVEADADLAVTPWRRGHRARLRAAVELPGLW